MKIRSWPWRHTWRLKVQRDTFGEPKAWSKITNLFHSITTYCELRKIRNAAACCAKTRGLRRTCTDMQGQWERVHESEVHGELGTLWQFVDDQMISDDHWKNIQEDVPRPTRGSRLAASTCASFPEAHFCSRKWSPTDTCIVVKPLHQTARLISQRRMTVIKSTARPGVSVFWGLGMGQILENINWVLILWRENHLKKHHKPIKTVY